MLLIFLGDISVSSDQTVSTGKEFPVNLPLAAVNGPQRTIVILVRFSDKPNSTSPSAISTILIGMNEYYNEDSYGTVSFQTDMTPVTSSQWYQMPRPMTYYGSDTSTSDRDLVNDGLQAAYNAGINLGNYKLAIIVHSGSDEALPPYTSSDIHSYTIPNYFFSPAPLTTYRISTAVVSENDPRGVYSHEAGHLLGLPDLYDVTGQIDPANNFVGYWEIMALGEWNPNTGLPPSPGTYPSHMSAWSKIDLGFVSGSRIATVQSGESANITIQNLEQPTNGVQAVKIPVAYNFDGTMTYYLLEMRAKLGTFDRYLPFPSTYPDAGLLVYKVNESIPTGHGSVKLIDAHPGGDLKDAPFGPCSAPCVSNNVFSDQSNYVKVIVTTTTPTAYGVTVDRTNSPVYLLQVNGPSAGVLVSVDGVNMTTDASKQLRLPVRYGPHTVFVQTEIPVSLGSTTVQIGLANAFSSWGDGRTANPLGVSIVSDTVLTAIYRITVAPSFTTAIVAAILLGVVVVGVTLHRRRKTPLAPSIPVGSPLAQPVASTGTVPTEPSSLPRDHVLSRDSVQKDKETEGPYS